VVGFAEFIIGGHSRGPVGLPLLDDGPRNGRGLRRLPDPSQRMLADALRELVSSMASQRIGADQPQALRPVGI